MQFATLSVTFSPDGQKLAIASHDGTVRIWDVQTGNCLHVLHAPQIQMIAVAFSPDGTLIAGSGEDEIVLPWKVESGEWVQTLHVDRLYEGMTITGATGLTPVQRDTLIAFGAVNET